MQLSGELDLICNHVGLIKSVWLISCRNLIGIIYYRLAPIRKPTFFSTYSLFFKRVFIETNMVSMFHQCSLDTIEYIHSRPFWIS